MEAIKGIPYGMSNFTDVMEQNCYYVDKTMYLPLLEDQAHYLIFTRSPTFRKEPFFWICSAVIMTFPERMTFDGDWRPALDFIARAYKDSSSVRSSIEGERNIQGFFTAYLSINAYYLTMPEVELNHGFCDMFLMPDLQRYPEVEHSYILELKYLPKDKFEAQSAEQCDAVLRMGAGKDGRGINCPPDKTDAPDWDCPM